MSRRRLWEDESERDAPYKEQSYESILKRFSKRPAPKPLLRLCSNALVVSQEFALTGYLLARHRIALWEEKRELSAKQLEPIFQQRVEMSTAAIVFALLVVMICSSRASATPQQARKTKFRQRLTDAFLLAILLRFLASVLRTLTASYSSDTVDSLAVAGMLVHLLACDYSYANGKSTIILHPLSSKRPIFCGGTMSLNAALFSTTLLVSRLQSNARAYFLVSLSVILFAFYPATRHDIASSYPPGSSLALWIITIAISISTLFLLENLRQMIFFVAVLIALVFVLPLWKFVLQRHKILVPGRWDIPRASSMKLDYTATECSIKRDCGMR